MPRDLAEYFARFVNISVDSSSEIDKRTQLLAIKDRVLYTWTNGGLRAAVGLKYSFNDRNRSRKCTFELEVKLNLSMKPDGAVEWLELNQSGSCLAICTNRCVYVAFLPGALWLLRSLNEVESEYFCRCISVENEIPRKSKDIKCLRAKWHPGSPMHRHLVTLWSDDVIRIYNVTQTSGPPFHIFLKDADVSMNSENGLTSFGDSAVSFDFGSPLEFEDNSKEELWPLFILCGNGDMYSVMIDLKANQCLAISGPIAVSPASDNSYGAGSCDVAFLHGKLPLLIIATTYGVLYHALIFRDEAMDTATAPCFRLHIVESVELEFSLSTVDLASTEIKEDNEASNVLLMKDPLIRYRYYALHRAGMHRIELPWAHEFDDESASVLTDASSNVQYSLCTAPKRSTNRSDSLPVGAVVLHSYSSESVSIVLLSDSSIYYLPATYDAAPLLTSNDKGGTKKSANRDYFIDTVKRLLQKGATVPVMRGQNDKQITEQEGAELMHRCIDVLQKEYVQRLTAARLACETHASEQCETFAQQNRDLARIQRAFAGVKERLASSKRRKEQLTKKQQELTDKLQSVTELMNGEGTTELSTQEEKMLQELRSLNKDMEATVDEFAEMKERIHSVSASQRAGRDSFSTPRQSQEASVKQRLEEQQRQIETLLRMVKTLQKENR